MQPPVSDDHRLVSYDGKGNNARKTTDQGERDRPPESYTGVGEHRRNERRDWCTELTHYRFEIESLWREVSGLGASQPDSETAFNARLPANQPPTKAMMTDVGISHECLGPAVAIGRKAPARIPHDVPKDKIGLRTLGAARRVDRVRFRTGGRIRNWWEVQDGFDNSTYTYAYVAIPSPVRAPLPDLSGVLGGGCAGPLAPVHGSLRGLLSLAGVDWGKSTLFGRFQRRRRPHAVPPFASCPPPGQDRGPASLID